jgi:hypothetical protein
VTDWRMKAPIPPLPQPATYEVPGAGSAALGTKPITRLPSPKRAVKIPVTPRSATSLSQAGLQAPAEVAMEPKDAELCTVEDRMVVSK